MGSYSRSVDGHNNRQPSAVSDGPICEVCAGRKYIMVATGTPSQSTTVYERQACNACSVDPDQALVQAQPETENVQPQSEKKTLSGTGYLRNKKRRRKSSV